jgi:hypothetical protein
MVKRFLLDGVDSEGARFPIHLADQLALMVTPITTDACLALCNLAVVGTELTLDPAIF